MLISIVLFSGQFYISFYLFDHVSDISEEYLLFAYEKISAKVQRKYRVCGFHLYATKEKVDTHCLYLLKS